MKRILSLLLAALMILGVFPIAALADSNLTIDVKYVDESGNEIFQTENQHLASILPGTSYSGTAEIIDVTGYNFKEVVIPEGLTDQITTSGDTITFNVTNIQSNIVVKVVYTAGKVKYTVMHYKQNVSDDKYSLAEVEHMDDVEAGTTPTISPKNYEGFTPLSIHGAPAAGDGSTVVQVFYNRDYHSISFDLKGGFGVEPVFDRYGKDVGDVGTPTRPGYSFLGWKKGEESATIPATIPAEDLKFTADWEVGTAKFDVIYWIQNADDDNYTYFCAEEKTAKSFTKVNGADYKRKFTKDDNGDYDDVNKFFHYGHADTNVEVQPDGSTFVNVYYDRNLYTITFKVGIPGETVHYEATTKNYYEGTIGGFPSVSLTKNVRNGLNNQKYGILLGERGVWTPLYTTTENWINNSIITTGSGAALVTEANPTSSNYGEKTDLGNWWFVPLYAGQKVTLLDVVDGVPTTYKMHVNDNADAGIKNTYRVQVDYYDNSGNPKTYTGYVFTGYVQNIQQKSEFVPAHDEVIPGQYYSYATAYPITKGDAYPIINIGGKTYDKEYTIQVRFGQTLAGKGIWPERENITAEVDGLPYKCNYTKTARLSTTTLELLTRQSTVSRVHLASSNPDVTTYFYVSYLKADHADTLHYVDLSLKVDGEYDEIDSQLCRFSGINYPNDLTHRDFPGYEYVGVLASGQNQNYTDRFGTYYSHDDTRADYYNYTFYYARREYNITYHNGTGDVEILMAKYKDLLSGKDAFTGKDYNFTPETPSGFPENAFVFDGWYTDPSFQQKFDFENTTMPYNAIELFAKWLPNEFTVTYRNTEAAEDKLDEQTVSYDEYAKDSAQKPSNEGRTFIGWFYKVDGVEKAFDPDITPIHSDLDVYGKWQNDAEIEYTIHYVLEDDHSVKVADDTNAASFYNTVAYAKGGTELYTDYQKGYFPTYTTQTLDLIGGTTEFWFYYREIGVVPYTVKYLDAETKEPVATEKVVSDNMYAVVDEIAEVVPGYIVDEAQKRIFIDFEAEENVLIFYYTPNTQNAQVLTVHLVSDKEGKGTYSEYQHDEITGTIGEEYTREALDLEALGYTLVKVEVNDVEDPTVPSSVTEELTADGLVFKFYYDYGAEETFKVVHHAIDGTEDKVETIKISDIEDTFDITEPIEDIYDGIREGYLYGGLYTEEYVVYTEDTWDYEDSDFCGKELTPKGGDIFYIKEVPDTYLRPKTLSFYNNSDDTADVLYSYMLTVVDSLDYITAGFMISDEEWKVESEDQITVDEEYVYETVTAESRNKQQVYGPTDLASVQFGYIVCDEVDYEDLLPTYKEEEDELTILPFFVTMDGIKVTGVINRSLIYHESGIPTVDDSDVVPTTTEIYGENSGLLLSFFRPLMLMSTFRAGVPQEEPVEEQNEGFVITKIVNGESDEEVVAGGSYVGEIGYPEVAGQRFAGWYLDEAFTEAADFSDIQGDMTVYAKYVSDDYQTLKFQTTVTKKVVTKVRPIMAVDGKNYSEVGFVYEIDGNTVTLPVSSYSTSLSGQSAKKVFGGDVASNAKLVIGDIATKGTADGTVISVKAYWVTKDGTTVYGPEKAVRYYQDTVELVEG